MVFLEFSTNLDPVSTLASNFTIKAEIPGTRINLPVSATFLAAIWFSGVDPFKAAA
jgi:hypothetical protein